MPKVHVHIDNGIATIELNNPDRRNAIDVEMAGELVDVCETVDNSLEIGGVVIQGAGGQFCSGGDRDDLDAATRAPLETTNFDRISVLYNAFVRVGGLQVPTVAAVRGAAVGAGLNLALAADLRVLATNARLIPGFVRLGFHPGGGHMHLLHRAAGPDTAAAMGMLGVALEGADAQRAGLAWTVCADEDVEANARALLATAAADPELARFAKKSYIAQTRSAAIDWPTALNVERVAQLWSFARAGTAVP
ncbi:enoyl-CoA hydratase-related protein [Nocardia sp. NPDC050630]|uniref:enoyl-CoA hydratase-related protein n=1 Tax=Nocardia sp. NPDC050630 TaxID=3364321 RepID=UPI00379F2406